MLEYGQASTGCCVWPGLGSNGKGRTHQTLSMSGFRDTSVTGGGVGTRTHAPHSYKVWSDRALRTCPEAIVCTIADDNSDVAGPIKSERAVR